MRYNAHNNIIDFIYSILLHVPLEGKYSRTPNIQPTQVSYLPKTVQTMKNFEQKKTQQFDVIHSVQLDRYLKTSRVYNR